MLASALICVSAVIFNESRGEGYKGQVAVASVVINRATKNNTSVCKEVTEKGQFPWAKDVFKKLKGQYHLQSKIVPNEAWFKSVIIASNLFDGTIKGIPNIMSFDNKPHPEWKMGKPIKIGKHYFYAKT